MKTIHSLWVCLQWQALVFVLVELTLTLEDHTEKKIKQNKNKTKQNTNHCYLPRLLVLLVTLFFNLAPGLIGLAHPCLIRR